MAGILILIIPLPLGLMIFSWEFLNKFERLFLLFSASSMLLMMIFTQSRGALISLGVVMICLIVLKFRWGWILVPFTILAYLILLVSVGKEVIVDFLSSGVSLAGIAGRLDVWARAIYMIEDFPVTGIGFGLFGNVVDLLYPLFLSAPGKVFHAHNLFLQISVDLGIPGLIAWVSILLIIFVFSVKLYVLGRSSENHFINGVGIGVLCSQVALVVHGIFDAVTWGMVRPAPIVWLIWGIALACWYVYTGNQPSKKKIELII
jgi:putative inorganic carbon (HCO3(-)) transporter